MHAWTFVTNLCWIIGVGHKCADRTRKAVLHIVSRVIYEPVSYGTTQERKFTRVDRPAPDAFDFTAAARTPWIGKRAGAVDAKRPHRAGEAGERVQAIVVEPWTTRAVLKSDLTSDPSCVCIRGTRQTIPKLCGARF